MARTDVGEASLEWRPTYLGYSVEDMSKWWVAARWGDDRVLYTKEEAEAMEMDYEKPWWNVWCVGKLSPTRTLHEILDDLTAAFDNYRECVEFCELANLGVEDDDREEWERIHPLNIGDYIRWEDNQMVAMFHDKRPRTGSPKTVASRKFFALKPTGKVRR